MRNLPLLFILLLCTCGPAQLCRAQSQSSDTLIVVSKLPYPKAKIWPHERSEQKTAAARAQRAEPSPLPRRSRNGEGPGERSTSDSEHPPAAALPNYNTTELQNCIHQRHLRLREADLATLTKAHKKDWLKYLPSVSAGLAPSWRQNNDGSVRVGLAPTLSIGLNSSLIYQAHRDKQQRAATRESIIKRSQLQEDLEIAKLHRLQRRLQIETDKLNLHTGVTDIDRQLFNLYQQQYDNHDITPEEYLLKRKAFLLQELRNQDQITRIEALQFEIEDLAGCLTFPSRKKQPTPLSETLESTRK